MQLFRKESDILVDVLETLRSEGIVALPVHDAVIVMDEHHLQATKIMKEVFEGHTGITPEVMTFPPKLVPRLLLKLS